MRADFHFLAATALAACLAGCGGGPVPEAAPSPQGAEPRVPVGAAPSRAVDLLFLGCRFACGELEGSVAIEEPDGSLSGAARDDAAAMLAELERLGTLEPSDAGAGPGGAGRGEEPRARAPRIYQLAASRGPRLDIDVEDRGGSAEALLLDHRGLRVELGAPSLVEFLRAASYRRLRHAMSPPRRPEAWHEAALAAFLTLDASRSLPFIEGGAGARAALRAEILDFLAATPDSEPLADALLSEAGIFSPAELDRFRGSGKASVRLLPLARAALDGDRRALGEILTLSLEYFGHARAFAGALSVAFPASVNPALHARYGDLETSEVVALAFVQEIRGRLPDARFERGVGWVLNP